MTKQRNRPGVGVYFALILLLLCGYYLFFDMTRVPGVSYAQVEDLFRREQVQSFYVKDGSELYLSLRDGATVRNELGSTDRFREDLGELIREQRPPASWWTMTSPPCTVPPGGARYCCTCCSSGASSWSGSI